MDKQTYLADPCGASSLPFWKTNDVTIPEGMLILREDDPRLENMLHSFVDDPYFRMIHFMRQIEPPKLPKDFCFFRPSEKELSDHIAACYDAERASERELSFYSMRPVYSHDLRLAIKDEASGIIVASGIGELDQEIREGVLEWIQVSPAYRRRGFGKVIVCELLRRMKGNADFVTVSGRESGPSCPGALYERCGFSGKVVWHVLKPVGPIRRKTDKLHIW